jgi:hypothetical protein
MKELQLLMEVEAMEESLSCLMKETTDHGGNYPLEESDYEDLVKVAIEEGELQRNRHKLHK